MASMTMAAATTTLLPNMTKISPSNGRRGSTMVIKASANGSDGEKGFNLEMKSNNNGGGRRELVFAATAAAVAACSVSKVAMAEDEEPKKGTPEAKKKYAPVCVTMPTARVCRK